jgi:hypothetical protein
VYQSVYYPIYKRFGREKVEKKIVIFAGFLAGDSETGLDGIRLTEHQSFHWEDWTQQKNYRNSTIMEAKTQLATFLGV